MTGSYLLKDEKNEVRGYLTVSPKRLRCRVDTVEEEATLSLFFAGREPVSYRIAGKNTESVHPGVGSKPEAITVEETTGHMICCAGDANLWRRQCCDSRRQNTQNERTVVLNQQENHSSRLECLHNTDKADDKGRRSKDEEPRREEPPMPCVPQRRWPPPPCCPDACYASGQWCMEPAEDGGVC